MSSLETLVHVHGSADYLEHKMADWSDDVFFIDLWEELEDRVQKATKPRASSNNAPANVNIGTPTTPNFDVSEVAAKTSKTLNDDDSIAQGALFDEITASYHKLRVGAEEHINILLATSLTEALRSYKDIDSWSALSSLSSGAAATQGDDQELSISSQLDAPLQLLSSYFSYLASVLGIAPLRRVGRQLALSVQESIWKIVTSKWFSEAGALQLRRDISAVCGVMDKYLGSGQSEQGMQKIVEALKLLGLNSSHTASEEDGEDEEEEDLSAWDEDAETKNGADRAKVDKIVDGSSRPLTLQEVTRWLFRDEKNGGKVLEELGISLLSVQEARKVMERRIDAAR